MNDADAGGTAWPVEIKLDPSKRLLSIAFDDGTSFSLSAEILRVESPSAEVQGHGGDHKVIVGGKRDVAIRALEPVGNYAIRIAFDDGHDTGLFSWRYLHRLGRDHDAIWQSYVSALEARGLSRD